MVDKRNHRWLFEIIIFTSLTLLAGVFGSGFTKSLAQTSVPWGTWNKYPGNPVLKDPDAQCFFPEVILSDVNDPLRKPILYPHPTLGNKYWLYYDTCWRGGARLAYSDDLIHWTPYENNPVLTASLGEVTLFIGHMFRDGAKYYLFYDVGVGKSFGTGFAIKYATANSPFGPWTKGSIILNTGPLGSWDEGRVTESFVFKYNNTYYLYYMADTVPPWGRREQVGAASVPAANFPQGPWTKQGLKLPVIPNSGAWDHGLAADPSIIQVGDIFYMLYTGSTGNDLWRLGIAWATDPLGPWNRPSSPVLYPGAAGSWESYSLLRGSIHYYNGKFYLPYAGSDGSNFRGGLATANSLVTPTPTQIPTGGPIPTPTITPTVSTTPTPTPIVSTPLSFKFVPKGGQVTIFNQNQFKLDVYANSTNILISNFRVLFNFNSAQVICLGASGIDSSVSANCSSSSNGGYLVFTAVTQSGYPKIFGGKIGSVTFQFAQNVNKAIITNASNNYPNGSYIIDTNGVSLPLNLLTNYCFSRDTSCVQ